MGILLTRGSTALITGDIEVGAVEIKNATDDTRATVGANGMHVDVQASTGVGSLTETAPTTDTASSGLNGRLQRIAQRLTSLIALLPTALGGGGGLKVDGSGTALPVSGTFYQTTQPISVASGQVVAGAEADGHSATLGLTTGAAVITDATGTIQQYLRGLVKLIISIITVKIDQTTPGTTNKVDASGAVPVVTNATGAVAIATSYAPGVAFWLESVTLHLSAAPVASENFTITLNANDGAAYDTKLYTLDLSLSGVTDLVYTPDDSPLLCEAGDSIDISWANSDARTYGMRIVTRLA